MTATTKITLQQIPAGILVLGYAMGALTKPIFAMAPTVGIVLTARLLDRVGKGVRGAPRDALVADTAPADLRGTAYGFFSLVSGVAMLLARDRKSTRLNSSH